MYCLLHLETCCIWWLKMFDLSAWAGVPLASRGTPASVDRGIWGFPSTSPWVPFNVTHKAPIESDHCKHTKSPACQLWVMYKHSERDLISFSFPRCFFFFWQHSGEWGAVDCGSGNLWSISAVSLTCYVTLDRSLHPSGPWFFGSESQGIEWGGPQGPLQL